jgi:hypothetical protein
MIICVPARSTAAANLSKVKLERMLFSVCLRRNHILAGTDSKRRADGAACKIVCSNSKVKSKSRHPSTRGPKRLSAPRVQSIAVPPEGVLLGKPVLIVSSRKEEEQRTNNVAVAP